MYKLFNGSRITRQSVFRQCCCEMSKNSNTEDPGRTLEVTDLQLKIKESNSVTPDQLQWKTSWHQQQGDHYSFLRTFYQPSNNRSLLQTLHSSIDISPSGIKKWWLKKVEEYEITTQSYIPERHRILGNELAAAHFIVYRGGAVKFFNEGKWIKANEYKEYNLPRHYQTDKYIQALDCSDMNIRYEGLVNIRGLKKVEWLSLNGCDHMDDWCLDTISNIFSHSLLYLDLRNCPKITYRGIGALYKMQNLKILYLDDFLKSTVYELTCLMLQEVNPHLDIKSDPVTFEIS